MMHVSGDGEDLDANEMLQAEALLSLRHGVAWTAAAVGGSGAFVAGQVPIRQGAGDLTFSQPLLTQNPLKPRQQRGGGDAATALAAPGLERPSAAVAGGRHRASAAADAKGPMAGRLPGPRVAPSAQGEVRSGKRGQATDAVPRGRSNADARTPARRDGKKPGGDPSGSLHVQPHPADMSALPAPTTSDCKRHCAGAQMGPENVCWQRTCWHAPATGHGSTPAWQAPLQKKSSSVQVAPSSGWGSCVAPQSLSPLHVGMPSSHQSSTFVTHLPCSAGPANNGSGATVQNGAGGSSSTDTETAARPWAEDLAKGTGQETTLQKPIFGRQAMCNPGVVLPPNTQPAGCLDHASAMQNTTTLGHVQGELAQLHVWYAAQMDAYVEQSKALLSALDMAASEHGRVPAHEVDAATLAVQTALSIIHAAAEVETGKSVSDVACLNK
uniref:Uncharacterized protein n=1 Tax=Chlamydomonas euryale TaxID=1486919 RepID=A0A7R9YXN7_9CHLO|mmetsp:Transcript_33163/g.98730  ORF Transcript_33163/g.98730 Transcript_33163/m.98730 type:complete len:440 (+) Transcript_33163:333-1652(+)